MMYKTDLSNLENKSVTGRGRATSKEQITPEKHSLFKKMFSERFDVMGLTGQDREKREKKLNQRLKDAINNINNSISTKNKKRKIIVMNRSVDVIQTPNEH